MEAITDFFKNADLLPMLSDWAIKLVLALAIYVIGKWIVKKITSTIKKSRGVFVR